jgi:hypothetical protein
MVFGQENPETTRTNGRFCEINGFAGSDRAISISYDTTTTNNHYHTAADRYTKTADIYLTSMIFNSNIYKLHEDTELFIRSFFTKVIRSVIHISPVSVSHIREVDYSVLPCLGV